MNKDIVKKIIYGIIILAVLIVIYKLINIIIDNNYNKNNNTDNVYTSINYSSTTYTESSYTKSVYTETVYTDISIDEEYNVSYFFYDVSNGSKNLIKSYNTKVKKNDLINKDIIEDYENFEYYLDSNFSKKMDNAIVSSDTQIYVKCNKIVTEVIKTGTETITWNSSWEFASFSELHNDSVKIYYPDKKENRKNITVTVNAGHGSPKGEKVYVYCHPDKSPKVASGSTKRGETKAQGVTSGTSLKGGVSESKANLSLALILKRVLLENGYNVLMIREDNDSELDNVARAVYANNNSDCHIALHYNSTNTNAGAFYGKVPQVKSFVNMYPVSKYWQQHDLLGETLISGMGNRGVKLRGSGPMSIDYVQTSYSTIPSVLVEVGDKASDLGSTTQTLIAMGILDGLNNFYHK